MNSEILRATLRKAEGVRPKVYIDSVGVPTIGVGRNLKDVGLRAEEIDFMLTNDIAAAWLSVTKTWPWVLGLSDVRQRALTEMCFQLGLGGLGAFVKALKAIEEGRWEDASVELLNSHWASQTPSRAERIAFMVRSDEDVPA